MKTVRGECFEMSSVTFGRGEKPMVVLPGLSLHPVCDAAEAIATAYADVAETYRITLFDYAK